MIRNGNVLRRMRRDWWVGPGRVRLFFYLPPIPGGASGLGALLSGNYINLSQRQS
jgi:hypothetical protein